MRRGPQNRPQLGHKQLGLTQTKSDRAPAQSRIFSRVRGRQVGRLNPRARQSFIRAHIDRSDRHRSPGHRAHNLPIGLILLVLVGQLRPVEKEKLGAQQSNAFGALGQGVRRLGGQFDIGLQHNRYAVARRRRQGQQRSQADPIPQVLGPALLDLLKQRGIGIHHQHAGIPVDHDQIIIANQTGGIEQSHHGRFCQPSRHNRRVRSGPPDIERKRTGVAPKQEIRRCRFRRNHHERFQGFARQRLMRTAPEQGPQDPIDDLAHIDHPLAQIGVLEGMKLLDELFGLGGICPLGITGLLADAGTRAFDQSRIDQHLGMHVQHGGGFDGRVWRQILGNGLQFGLNTGNCVVESLQLRRHLGGRNPAPGRVTYPGRQNPGTSDRHATRERLAVQNEHRHRQCLRSIMGLGGSGWSLRVRRMQSCRARACTPQPGSSLKPAANSSTRADRAWASSGPSVSIPMAEPLAAASIITPMMLLALTRRLFRLNQTSARNRDATWVTWADGRAWSPSGLMTTTSRYCMGATRSGQWQDLDDGLTTAHQQSPDQVRQRLRAAPVGQAFDQHRQVHARQDGDSIGFGQTRGDARRRRAPEIGQHQDTAAVIDPFEQFTGRVDCHVGILIGDHIERGELGR